MRHADPTVDMGWKSDSPVPRITVKGTRCRIAGYHQVCIRIARVVERKGGAKTKADRVKRKLTMALLRGEGVLFAGRPSTGKTTLMREVARSLSLALPYVALLVSTSSQKVVALDSQREFVGEDPDFEASGLVTSSCQAGNLKVNMGQAATDAVQVQNPSVVVLDEIADAETSDTVRAISSTVTVMGSTHLSIDSQAVCTAANMVTTDMLDAVTFAVADTLLSDPAKTALLGGVQYTTLGDTTAKEEEVTKEKVSSETASRPFQHVLYMDSTRPQDWHIVPVKDMLEAYFGVRNTTNPRKTFGPMGTLQNFDVGANRAGCVLYTSRPTSIKAVAMTCASAVEFLGSVLERYYNRHAKKELAVAGLNRAIANVYPSCKLWLFSRACEKCRKLPPDKVLKDIVDDVVKESPGNARLSDVWPNLRESGEDFDEAFKAIPKAPLGFYDAFVQSKDTFQFAIVCGLIKWDLFGDAREAFKDLTEDEFRKKYPKMLPKVGEKLLPAKQTLLTACTGGSATKKRKRE